jgi:hypothetical protein
MLKKFLITGKYDILELFIKKERRLNMKITENYSIEYF